jgi:hypothetical protein
LRDIAAVSASASEPVAHPAPADQVFSSKLSACKSNEHVLALFDSVGTNPSLDQNHIGALISKLNATKGSLTVAEDARFIALFNVALSFVPQQSPADFASFLLRCSKLGCVLPIARLPWLWESSANFLHRASATELRMIMTSLCKMHTKPSDAWLGHFWKVFTSTLSSCPATDLAATLSACVDLNAAPPANLLSEWMQTCEFKDEPIDFLSSSSILHACTLFSLWPASTQAPFWSRLGREQLVRFKKFHQAYLLAAVEHPGAMSPQDASAVIEAAQNARKGSKLLPTVPSSPLEIEVAALLSQHGFAFKSRAWCGASAVHIALTLPAHRIAIEVNERADFNVSKDDEASEPAYSLCGPACFRRRLLEKCGKWRVVSVSAVEWAPDSDGWDDERPARARQALIAAIRELGAVAAVAAPSKTHFKTHDKKQPQQQRLQQNRIQNQTQPRQQNQNRKQNQSQNQNRNQIQNQTQQKQEPAPPRAAPKEL